MLGFVEILVVGVMWAEKRTCICRNTMRSSAMVIAKVSPCFTVAYP